MIDERQSGVALLTVLLIVLALSGLAVAALDDLRRGQRLEANAASLSQAQWYALGADAYVQRMAADLRTRGLARAALEDGVHTLAYPLDHGLMEIRVRNASTCVNLNGVAAGAGDIYQRHETGAAELKALLQALGVPEGEAGRLVDSLVDWIDTDEGARGVGRDDAPYASGAPRFLSAREPLAEFSELRTVAGFSDQIVAMMKPYACAHPSVGPSLVDVNGLTPEHAPVLAALAQGQISLALARSLLVDRPADGWADVETFLAARQLDDAWGARDLLRPRLAVEPDHLHLTIRIAHLDADFTISESLAWRGDRFVVTARRWGQET
jgi:general secretion pathway protein K